MGTATITNSKPPMEKEKRPNLMKLITTLFQKKNKKHEQQYEKKDDKSNKSEHDKREEKHNKPLKVTPVATLLEEFQKIAIKDREEDKNNVLNNFTYTRDRKDSTDDKDHEFERVESRNDRFGSHSSQDSGYSEMGKDIKGKKDIKDEIDETEEVDDVTKKTEDLKIGKKKLQTVYLPRAPIRNRGEFVPTTHPYAAEVEKYREVVNTNTFSGGQVFVKPSNDHLTEINRALSTIETNVQNFPQNDDQQNFLLETGFEFVAQETSPEPEFAELLGDIHEYIEKCTENILNHQTFNKDPYDISHTIRNFDFNNQIQQPDIAHLQPDITNLYQPDISIHIDDQRDHNHAFPTPPYSENALSPLSLNLGSPPLTNSEYILSPGRSPINNHDLERYQEIPEGHELPNFQDVPVQDVEKPVQKMSMKQYKDLQKELSAGFSKFDCCLMTRKPCKEIFEGHAKKLKMEERKGLCVKLARLDTKTAYELDHDFNGPPAILTSEWRVDLLLAIVLFGKRVLQHVLFSLSTDCKQEDLQCALFSLLCERVLAQRPDLFLGDFGFGLLKSAVLRCYQRPLFARYLVQCIRTAIRLNPSYMEGRDSVFHETDALGDTLVTACARAGDAFADVLNELVCDSPPLFRLQHANTEGYTALHVACKQHSADTPHLRIAHVLLEHGKADLWAGDVKGGDTALHLAVNSSTCELRLVMVLFRHVERVKWKQLAHVVNRSSVTPIEYARSQSRSVSRRYPPEVLDFLKKCR